MDLDVDMHFRFFNGLWFDLRIGWRLDISLHRWSRILILSRLLALSGLFQPTESPISRHNAIGTAYALQKIPITHIVDDSIKYALRLRICNSPLLL